MSPNSLYAAVAKVAAAVERNERSWRRDFWGTSFSIIAILRRLEVLNAALDSVNLVGNERLRNSHG